MQDEFFQVPLFKSFIGGRLTLGEFEPQAVMRETQSSESDTADSMQTTRSSSPVI